jgi:hypothetical protein
MRRLLAAILSTFVLVSVAAAQQKVKTDGYGSLVGKVRLSDDSPIPEQANLVPLMAKHADAACCLGPKAKLEEKADTTWIVDKKTRGVANVVVWVKAPAKSYFEIHPNFKVRKDDVVIDQPHCAFLPRIAAIHPSYFDGTKSVPTGQKFIIKNSAACVHSVKAVFASMENDDFNINLPSKSQDDFTNRFNPQRLPATITCAFHTWMRARVHIFDHPYYAITKVDGSYEIPFVPAGAEIAVMAYHDDQGFIGGGPKGTPITFEKDKKRTHDIEIKLEKKK